MIQPRYGHGVVKVGNAIYAIAGRHIVDLEAMEVYDIRKDTWTFVMNLPVPIWCCTGTVHNKSIYLSGYFNTELMRFDYRTSI
jgi:hypothetical protein